MSKEKQIDEMAKVIARRSTAFRNQDVAFMTTATKTAESLYNAGYRKQIVGEWKKVSDKYPSYVCTACNHLYNNKGYKYCPNCGAKMKGGE